jgi:hypothetical protein
LYNSIYKSYADYARILGKYEHVAWVFTASLGHIIEFAEGFLK